ncbi:DUF3224 domain-containing protein [Haliangium ochraceum]|uniref:DUF3224 domain-containing protein n=1 Tax=Haliangium ochraceum (strain DSM 14365 / JCM 11303 / SMP-2) TaxID=502025 RepID=D0LTZ1_HALO1|nr:DUF3224 domain-containing protein [Haliangium ochraceum]ACY17355.1 conserved hypothetical protein [Haliangium ochraceum DSM 14365]
MNAKGTFTIEFRPEPPLDQADGITLARMSGDKRFSGPLEAESAVHMLSARASEHDSAAYVAIERVVGTLGGKRGSFVLVHRGVSDRGQLALTVAVVPDSGTGALRGLSGEMAIAIEDGAHHYDFEYSLPS